MNDGTYSSPSEQLSALLDGELSATESSPLFYELANNPELQEEMHQMLAMKKLFQGTSIIPPDNLKHRILLGAGLGITAGSVIPQSTISSFFQNAGQFLQTHGFYMALSGVVTGLATTLALNWNALFNAPEKATAPLIAQKTENFQTPEQQKPEVIIKYIEKKVFIPVEKKIFVQVPAEANIASKEDNIPIEPVQPAFDKQLYLASKPIGNKNYFANDFANNGLGHMILPNTQIAPRVPNKAFRTQTEDKNKFSFTLRQFAAASIPTVDLKPISEPTLNNLALSLMYFINPNHAFGIEIGQENIEQQFTGMDGNKEITWTQNYLAFWTGGLYQFSFDPIENLGDIIPFTKIFLGGTRVGPYAKTSFGFRLPLSENVAIMSGLEYSYLYYQFQGKNFNTQKFGATYGLVIKF
ncbi:MAG: hypothetical protein HW421_2431 [Ignavibacteria bacterium]|nr:hypothetical protein [Ignavibacteria bacterium]